MSVVSSFVAPVIASIILRVFSQVDETSSKAETTADNYVLYLTVFQALQAVAVIAVVFNPSRYSSKAGACCNMCMTMLHNILGTMLFIVLPILYLVAYFTALRSV